MLHDAKSELRQKLLTIEDLPATPLMVNISKTINPVTWKKYTFWFTFKGQLIDTYSEPHVLVLIFDLSNTYVSTGNFQWKAAIWSDFLSGKLTVFR